MHDERTDGSEAISGSIKSGKMLLTVAKRVAVKNKEVANAGIKSTRVHDFYYSECLLIVSFYL